MNLLLHELPKITTAVLLRYVFSKRAEASNLQNIHVALKFRRNFAEYLPGLKSAS